MAEGQKEEDISGDCGGAVELKTQRNKSTRRMMMIIVVMNGKGIERGEKSDCDDGDGLRTLGMKREGK